MKSGNRVAVGGAPDEPEALPDALWNRWGELRDVKILHLCPTKDYPWCQPGQGESFQAEVLGFLGPAARHRAKERTISLIPNGWRFSVKAGERDGEGKAFDVFLVKMSTPNEHGFCCFGPEIWLKKDWARKARKIIAEVDSNEPEEKWVKILQYSREVLPHQRPRFIAIFEILDVPAIDSIAETAGLWWCLKA